MHDRTSRNIKPYLSLWPCVAGLGIGRASVVVSSYGSYTSSDAGIFTDGSTLIMITFMGLVLLVIAAKKAVLSNAFVKRLAFVCVVAEAASLFLLALSEFLGATSFPSHLGITTSSMIGAAGAIYYWLRKARGTSALAATILVFASILLSEVIVFPFTVIPAAAGFCLAGIIALFQLPLMRLGKDLLGFFASGPPTASTDYFGYAKTMRASIQFMVVTALGLGGLAVVSGLLRGFPNGLPIPFTLQTRMLYSLTAIALCAVIILCVFKGIRWIMVPGIWLIMQFLAFLSLLLYSILPNSLEYGAVFATVLNVIIMGFNWYLTIAFMTHGWRDPLYYAFSGWVVWFGGRALGRIILLQIYPLTSNDFLMATAIGGLLLFSTQLVFLKFTHIIHDKQAEEAPTKTLMGLDFNQSFTNIRQSAMEQSAKEMGRQFLLSDRETEVLVLYALGFTQKRVAEELFITQGTAHGHIKRIYMKTGLHSRQQLIDYMRQYTL